MLFLSRPCGILRATDTDFACVALDGEKLPLQKAMKISTTKYALFLFAHLATGLFLLGCAHTTGGPGGPSVTLTSESFKYFSGEFENTEAMRARPPKTVAVLPFYGDESQWTFKFESENPTEIVRRGMYNHISSLAFSDLELFEVDLRLKNAGLKSWEAIERVLKHDPKRLKSILGVDAVVTGEVTHFDRVFVGIASQVAVGCEVKMIGLRDGKLLWRAKNVSRGFAGGVSLNPIGLVINAVASIWNLRGVELLRQTDDLFREMASTIYLPESLAASRITPPNLDLFACVGKDTPYRAGETALFRIVGDANCEAYADLLGFQSHIRLVPVSTPAKDALMGQILDQIKAKYAQSGHTLTPELVAAIQGELASREVYEGSFAVEPGVERYGLLAKGYLVNESGGQSSMLFVARKIDLDSVPPRTPENLVAEPLDTKVTLSWDQSPEGDLAGYEIWTSKTGLSGFGKVATVETNKGTVPGLNNFEPVFLRVKALDLAGNESEFSPNVKSAPLPEPGLLDLPAPGPNLGGEIREKTLLRTDKGPFSVQSDLTVMPGGALYIEPGAILRFAAGTSLKVLGGDILAFGRTDAAIRLVPGSNTAAPGAFAGVVLEGARRAYLNGMFIERARTGLVIKDCGPEISNLVIRESSQAGLHLLDRAGPNMSCSKIIGNSGMGGMVLEGEGLAPRIRSSVFQDNAPFDVQSFAPIEIDLSGNFWTQAQTLGNVRVEPALQSPPEACP